MAALSVTQVEPSSSTDVAFSAAAAVIPIANRPSRLIVAEPIRQWRKTVVERLQELVRLPVGWDGYRGEPVTFLNANFALRMLEAVCGADTPVPQIVPGSSGDLQIEWHLPYGDIELHVRAPNDVGAWHFNASTGIDGEGADLTNNFLAVANWIEDLERLGAAASAA